MLLIRQQNKRSTKRLTVKYLFLHKHLQQYKKNTKWVQKNAPILAGRPAISHKKFFKKTEKKQINTSFLMKEIYFITNFSNFTTKTSEFTIAKNIYNQQTLLPTAATFYPGFKLYPYTYLVLLDNIKRFVGQIIPLVLVPINMAISFLFNKYNSKSSYIRSTGSKGVRKRFNRHSKVVNVLLPSGQVKIFPTFTLTLFSGTYNLEANRVVEGSWGYFSKNKKKIFVRGVAKNPVDHPNGGRTKAKQPELSP